MAQSGYTPIQLYYSSTTTNTPSAGNLANGELAINITDGKLFYKDNTGTVQTIAYKNVPLNTVTGTLAIANGGTNITTYTTGDILYASASNTLSKLAAGTNGQVLTLAAGVPTWATASSGGITTGKAIAMAMIFGF